MNDSTDTPVDRDTLYEEVWRAPVSVVATRYGLSDVGLAKICRSLSIPLPSRGYWAKVKAGKVMNRAPLPKLSDSRPMPTGLKKLPAAQAAVREAARKEVAKIRREAVPEGEAPDASAPQHVLVKTASKRLRQRDDWPKDTGLRSAPGEVLNVTVTRATLDRALLITDVLLKALAPHGVSARVDEKQSVTVLEVQTPPAAMEFSLTEQVKRTRHEDTPAEKRARERYHERWRLTPLGDIPYPSIPQYDYHPTGVLHLKVGRWPGRTWRDTPKTPLERRLGEVVAGVLALAQEIHAKEVEAARRAEALRRAQERYDFLTRRRSEEVERFNQFEGQAMDWERAMRLRNYARAVEERALADGGLTAELRDWLEWARTKADWLDPLIQVSDAILDAPEPKRPSYW